MKEYKNSRCSAASTLRATLATAALLVSTAAVANAQAASGDSDGGPSAQSVTVTGHSPTVAPPANGVGSTGATNSAAPQTVTITAVSPKNQALIRDFLERETDVFENWFNFVWDLVGKTKTMKDALALADKNEFGVPNFENTFKRAFNEAMRNLTPDESAGMRSYRAAFQALEQEAIALKAAHPAAWAWGTKSVNDAVTRANNSFPPRDFPGLPLTPTTEDPTLGHLYNVTDTSAVAIDQESGLPYPVLTSGAAYLATTTPYLALNNGEVAQTKLTWMANTSATTQPLLVYQSIDGGPATVVGSGNAGSLNVSVTGGHFYAYQVRRVMFRIFSIPITQPVTSILVNTVPRYCSPWVSGTFSFPGNGYYQRYWSNSDNRITQIKANGSTIQFTTRQGNTNYVTLGPGMRAFADITADQIDGYALLGPSQLGFFDGAGNMYSMTFAGTVLRGVDLFRFGTFSRYVDISGSYFSRQFESFATSVRAAGNSMSLSDDATLSGPGIIFGCPPPAAYTPVPVNPTPDPMPGCDPIGNGGFEGCGGD